MRMPLRRPRFVRRPRRLPRSVFKFAIFAAVCLVLLVLLAVKIGNLSLFTSRTGYTAQLRDVTGLASGDPVEIAGVPVGQVGGITVQRGHALVALQVRNGVALRSSTDVGLRWRNVIGQKVVYLYPGRAGTLLRPGSSIPLSHDVSDASVNALLNSLGPFLQSINAQEANAFVENVSGALQGDTVQIDQLINNGAVVAKTVGSLNTEVGTVIDSMDRVLTAIASRSGDLSTLVTNLQNVARSLAAHNTVLEDLVTNLSAVAGDLANLVGTNRTNLDGSISNLNAVLTTLDQQRQNLAHGLSTLGAGLAPYTEVSAWGQWFQIQPVYTCLANETTCSFYEPPNAPAGSGPLGAPPGNPLSSLPGASSLPGSASLPQAGGATSSAAPDATGGSAAASQATSGLGQMLQTVAGGASHPSVGAGAGG